MASPGAMLPPELDYSTTKPPQTRRPSYRQSYASWRGGGDEADGRGPIHAIRAATYMSGALATPHGSAAEFKRVSSVNLLARSVEDATALYDELEKLDDRLKVSGLLGGCLGVAATASFLNGYHTSVMNSAASSALPGHGLVAWSFAVAALPLGGPFGSGVGGWMGEGRRLGRDGALWVIGAVYGVGALGLCAALRLASMRVLVASRLLLGVACGATTVVVPVYLGELAPPRLRGTFGTLTQLAMVTGILAADVVALGAKAPALFGCSAAIAAAMLVLAGALPLVPSPQSALTEHDRLKRKSLSRREDDPSEPDRWLGAVDLCKRLYLLDDEAAREEAHAMSLAVESRAAGEDPVAAGRRTIGGLGSPAPPPGADDPDVAKRAHRKLLVATLVLHVAQQLSGINAVFYYSTTFLAGVIESPALGTALVGAVNVGATLLASGLMDDHRRVSMLALSLAGMLAAAVVMTAALGGYLGNAWALAGVVGYVFFFELGLGPIPWMIVPELFTADKVVPAQALASQLNWTMNVVVGLGFPALNACLGPYCFVPFACVLVVTLAFVLTSLPETYGRTPDDVYRELVIDDAMGGSAAHGYGYGAVSTRELEYELARAQATMARTRSKLKMAGH